MANSAPVTQYQGGISGAMKKVARRGMSAKPPKNMKNMTKTPRPLLSIKQQNLQGESGSGQGL